MALHNTAIRYGAVTKFFHWFIALLVITLIALGLYASDLPFETQAELGAKAWYFSLHKTLGVTVFLAALARISWALFQPRPGLLNADHRWESWLAETTHWVLYRVCPYLVAIWSRLTVYPQEHYGRACLCHAARDRGKSINRRGDLAFSRGNETSFDRPRRNLAAHVAGHTGARLAARSASQRCARPDRDSRLGCHHCSGAGFGHNRCEC